jgi:hypothetical protein
VSKGSKDEKPGNLFHLEPSTMKLSKADTADKAGIYFLRHGATAWNEGHAGPSPTGPKISAKMLGQAKPIQV